MALLRTKPAVSVAVGTKAQAQVSSTAFVCVLAHAAVLASMHTAGTRAPISAPTPALATPSPTSNVTASTKRASATGIQISGLVPSSKYALRVRAHTLQGDGEWSPFLSFTTENPSCIPLCSQFGRCAGPCKDPQHCACSCIAGWGTAEWDTTCSDSAPYLLNKLKTAFVLALDGNITQSIAVLEEEKKSTFEVYSDDLFTPLAKKLKMRILSMLHNLQNGLDITGKSDGSLEPFGWRKYSDMTARLIVELKELEAAQAATRAGGGFDGAEKKRLIEAQHTELHQQISDRIAAATESAKQERFLFDSMSEMRTQCLNGLENFQNVQSEAITDQLQEIDDHVHGKQMSAYIKRASSILSFAKSLFTLCTTGAITGLWTLLTAVQNVADFLKKGKDLIDAWSNDPRARFPSDPSVIQAQLKIQEAKTYMSDGEAISYA